MDQNEIVNFESSSLKPNFVKICWSCMEAGTMRHMPSPICVYYIDFVKRMKY